MEKIIIVDFGSQYTWLIFKNLRKLRVYSEIRLPDDDIKDCKGIILSGGPKSVYYKKATGIDNRIFGLGIPILGLCYGHQLLAHLLDGKVGHGSGEYGLAELNVADKKDIFKGLADKETVWMSHGDSITELPSGFKIYGYTDDCKMAAIGNPEKKIYGLQFHPEVTHTENGIKILNNFIDVCGVKKEWSLKNYSERIMKEIKEFSGNKKVLTLVSGGIDSAVTFILLNRVLDRGRVVGLYIDNGLMRLNENDFVKDELGRFGNLYVFDAENLFLEKLKGVVDPEEKRRIIGEAFLEAKDIALRNLHLGADWLLAQGTIYPDTIETKGTVHAAKIKTHHNRIEAIKKLIEQNKVIEPLKELYKDEVRELAHELGLSERLIKRHPFPGPGLAVRCLCVDKEEAIVDMENMSDLKIKCLPIKTVGVQGDKRTYKQPALLIGNADWAELGRLSIELTNKIASINRVLYLLTEDVEFRIKKCSINKERLKVLRIIDDIVTKFLFENELYDRIWQMPVVLIPLVYDDKESVILRPVSSIEAMTAKFFGIERNILDKLVRRILATGKISGIFYDITNKPPATIELE